MHKGTAANSLTTTAIYTPTVGLGPCPSSPTPAGLQQTPRAGGGRLGGICRSSWATAFGHIPASCPENLIKHCPSPLLFSAGCQSVLQHPSLRSLHRLRREPLQRAAREGLGSFPPPQGLHKQPAFVLGAAQPAKARQANHARSSLTASS